MPRKTKPRIYPPGTHYEVREIWRTRNQELELLPKIEQDFNNEADDDFTTLEVRNYFKRLMQKLGEIELANPHVLRFATKIIQLRAEGYTFDEIALIFDSSRNQVSSLESRVCRRIKAHINFDNSGLGNPPNLNGINSFTSLLSNVW